MGTTRFWLIVCGLLLFAQAHAANMRIDDRDAGTGRGFDSDQAVAPVAGNDATTLGGQRMAALRYAASIVASRVASPVSIRIAASFAGNNGGGALACTPNSATLGLGGASQYTANFDGAPRANTDYPLPLANALAGRRLADADGIVLSFNPRLDAGEGDCLQGATWYYGLDGKPGAGQLDFLATAVHELIHGLGFQSLVTLTDGGGDSIGQFPQYSNDPDSRYPDVFSTFIQDLEMPGQPFWPVLTDSERARSITDGRFLVWGDANTDSVAAGYLDGGFTQGRVRLYAPDPVEPGSSVSHWSLALAPDQIMEPLENPKANVMHGIGMAACVLENMGWQLANGTRCPDVDSDTIAGQTAVESSGSSYDSDGHNNSDGGNRGGGGGGCTIDPNAAFDPLWLLMLALASGIVFLRRRRSPRA